LEGDSPGELDEDYANEDYGTELPEAPVPSPIPTHAQSGYEADPRTNPATYPRSPTTKLPIPPYRVIKTETDLVNYFAALTYDDWAHCVLYIYQAFPKHRKEEGGYGYLEKHGEWKCDLDGFIAAVSPSLPASTL